MIAYEVQTFQSETMGWPKSNNFRPNWLLSMRDSTPTIKEPLTQPEEMTINLRAVAISQDKTAFAALFAYYGPRLKAYMRSLGANDGTAEELAQEAMLSVWRKARQFNADKASAGTWIFTIARNLRIDALRKERRPEIDPNDPALVPDSDPEPDIQASMEQQRVLLHKAIHELPKDQALVIKKSFFEDKPHAVISSELNIPLGTVKSRLRLAFNRVRSHIGDQL
jgi:RNA polymerase sigma-70 factor (ECF subfamily)